MRLQDEDYKKIYDWWCYLHGKKNDISPDRAGRARLRRCRTLLEITFEPAFIRLYSQFNKPLIEPDQVSSGSGKHDAFFDMRKLAAIAGLLAHIDELVYNPQSSQQDLLAKKMGGNKKEGIPIKEIRFRRLLDCQTVEELFPLLLRAVRILSDKVDLRSLVNSIYYWSENIKQQWAYAYYSTIDINKE